MRHNAFRQKIITEIQGPIENALARALRRSGCCESIADARAGQGSEVIAGSIAIYMENRHYGSPRIITGKTTRAKLEKRLSTLRKVPDMIDELNVQERRILSGRAMDMLVRTGAFALQTSFLLEKALDLPTRQLGANGDAAERLLQQVIEAWWDATGSPPSISATAKFGCYSVFCDCIERAAKLAKVRRPHITFRAYRQAIKELERKCQSEEQNAANIRS